MQSPLEETLSARARAAFVEALVCAALLAAMAAFVVWGFK